MTVLWKLTPAQTKGPSRWEGKACKVKRTTFLNTDILQDGHHDACSKQVPCTDKGISRACRPSCEGRRKSTFRGCRRGGALQGQVPGAVVERAIASMHSEAAAAPAYVRGMTKVQAVFFAISTLLGGCLTADRQTSRHVILKSAAAHMSL